MYLSHLPTTLEKLSGSAQAEDAHQVGGNRKRSSQSTDADQKSIEIVFLIVICRQSGDK